MTTQAPQAPGAEFTNNVLRDALSLLQVNTANTAIGRHAPVSVSTNDGENPDQNVTALTGVIRLGPGDAVYLDFAKSGTITAGTFFVGVWFPIRDINGKIIGYDERPYTDVGSSLAYGSVATGTQYATIQGSDGTTPASPPVGTEVWANAITANVGGVAVSVSAVLNNMDLLKVADDGPCTLRITPIDGATHVRVAQKTGGGGGTMFCFARRGRGAALNKFN
jgi:hypothetical protein